MWGIKTLETRDCQGHMLALNMNRFLIEVSQMQNVEYLMLTDYLPDFCDTWNMSFCPPDSKYCRSNILQALIGGSF